MCRFHAWFAHPGVFLFCFLGGGVLWEKVFVLLSPLHSYSNHSVFLFCFWEGVCFLVKILVLLLPPTNHLSPFWEVVVFFCFLLIVFFVSIYMCMCGCCCVFLFNFFPFIGCFLLLFFVPFHTHHDAIFLYIHSTYFLYSWGKRNGMKWAPQLVCCCVCLPQSSTWVSW